LILFGIAAETIFTNGIQNDGEIVSYHYNEKARELNYEVVQIDQLEKWVEKLEDIGSDVFIKQWK